jgi:hypothetical protein
MTSAATSLTKVFPEIALAARVMAATSTSSRVSLESIAVIEAVEARLSRSAPFPRILDFGLTLSRASGGEFANRAQPQIAGKDFLNEGRLLGNDVELLADASMPAAAAGADLAG